MSGVRCKQSILPACLLALSLSSSATGAENLSCPFPTLPPEHETYLNEVLTYWERSSGEIKRFSAKIQRWQYEPVFGPRDTSSSYSTGFGTYEAPDKWSYKIDKVLRHRGGGEKPRYELKSHDSNEFWVCDGNSLFEFDYAHKRLVERTLPVEMRGRMLDINPLPFLFQIGAERLKERFWIRVVTPNNSHGEYWLEFFPKTRRDAARFKRVELIIDEMDFFPKAIRVFAPGSSDQPAYVLEFTDRVKNGDLSAKSSGVDFHAPIPTPKSWERVREDGGIGLRLILYFSGVDISVYAPTARGSSRKHMGAENRPTK